MKAQTIHMKLWDAPRDLHDKLCKLAAQRDVSVRDLHLKALEKFVREEN